MLPRPLSICLKTLASFFTRQDRAEIVRTVASEELGWQEVLEFDEVSLRQLTLHTLFTHDRLPHGKFVINCIH